MDETFSEDIDVAKLGETETTAVTLEFASDDESAFPSPVIEEDGNLYWILSNEDIDSFESGVCP
ncbi:MAG: hypothetical protein R3A46_11325 [Thermomicrobiales bacterium]